MNQTVAAASAPPNQSAPRLATEFAQVIGIYGLPGSGKTFILKTLEKEMESQNYLFFEGSTVLSKIHPGGLEGFLAEPEEKRRALREAAVRYINAECLTKQKAGVVTGHLMFWPQDSQIIPSSIHTQADMDIYSHIIYLDVPNEVIAQRRQNDATRDRGSHSIARLQEWKEREIFLLRNLCSQNKITFVPVSGSVGEIKSLIRKFAHYTSQAKNSDQAIEHTNRILEQNIKQPQRMFVIDGDKTLVPNDTGKMLWQSEKVAFGSDTLAKVFESMGYDYTAFMQVALLHNELGTDAEFEKKCDQVADEVCIYPDFLRTLKKVAKEPSTEALVVTCGLQMIWEKILQNFKLFDKIKVVGAGRGVDGLVMTPDVKYAIVAYLQKKRNMNVWAFGDSPLDLLMLRKADHAFVAVGHEETRSKSMEKELENAIKVEGSHFRPRQTLLREAGNPLPLSTRPGAAPDHRPS